MTRLSVRAFANNRDIDLAAGVSAQLKAFSAAGVRAWLASDWAAAEIWWLGHGMTPVMLNGPVSQKYTIVVVGDGFAAGDQDAYNDMVDNLLTDSTTGLFAQDFFAANRPAFNVLRVNLVSVDSEVSTKTYSGTTFTTVNRDTALGAYFNGDWAHCWVEDGPDTATRLEQALSVWAPEYNLVFVLLNNPGFGGCGGGGRITAPMGIDWTLVAHELGHGLGGLADEYCGTVAYTGGEPGAINVTIDTNRTTLKWRTFVDGGTPLPTGTGACAGYTAGLRPPTWDDNQDVGLFEGATLGAGNGFGTGVYRPVVNCRMRTNQPPYCPVCRSAMDTIVAPHLANAATPSPSARPPEKAAMNDDSERYVRMVVRYESGHLRIVRAREIKGRLVRPQTVAFGLAHEVRLGDRRVALGSMPDVNVVRSMNDPSVGPREHHTYVLDTFEFVVRLPVSELRGADLTAMTVNLVEVRASKHMPLSGVPLDNDPTIVATTIASLRPDDVAELPAALRQARDPAM
jgi:hypothetical protein